MLKMFFSLTSLSSVIRSRRVSDLPDSRACSLCYCAISSQEGRRENKWSKITLLSPLGAELVLLTSPDTVCNIDLGALWLCRTEYICYYISPFVPAFLPPSLTRVLDYCLKYCTDYPFSSYIFPNCGYSEGMLKLSVAADVIYLTVQEDLSVSGSSCWDVKCHSQLNQVFATSCIRPGWAGSRWLFWCFSPGTSPALIAWCWRAPLGLMGYHEHK